MTLSFNLLQRAWPVEHVSWGWEQTLAYWSPNGNYYFLCVCFEENLATATLLDLGFVLLPRSPKGQIKKKKAGARAKVSKLQRGVCWEGRFTNDDLWTKKKKIKMLETIEALVYHFLVNIWYLRMTSIRALNHSASSVCCQSRLTYCLRSGNGRVCRRRRKPAFGERN